MSKKRVKYFVFMRIFSSVIILLLFMVTAAFAQKNTMIQGAAIKYKIKVLETLPHDINSYTQGLFFYNQQLYESAGQKGESNFRKVDLAKGTTLKIIKFPNEYFAEGSTVVNDKLFILTWQERVVFVYDINTFKKIKTYYNPNDGWGLTTDGKQLIASDGSSTLYFINPDNFSEISRIEVKLNGKSIDQLNELEYISGDIWANIYQTDLIVIINPKNGVVKATIDCSNLLPENLRTPKTDVLNGIAYNPVSKQIYITGKYWPKMYRIQLVN